MKQDQTRETMHFFFLFFFHLRGVSSLSFSLYLGDGKATKNENIKKFKKVTGEGIVREKMNYNFDKRLDLT